MLAITRLQPSAVWSRSLHLRVMIEACLKPGLSSPMKTYRAYLLSPGGKITWGEWIEAADLTEAEEKARALCDAGAPTVELWDGAVPVSDVPCDPELPPKRIAVVGR